MTNESVEERLRRLEDIEAIKQMHLEYTYALMAMQYDKMLECYADDGVLELGPGVTAKGKQEINGVFQNVLAKHSTLKDGHIISQPVITVDGDRARGHWLLFIFPPTEPKGEWIQGREETEYVKVGGQWKIKRMKFLRGWPQPEAATH
jgi:ketosteroid isomerase-like protein